MSVSIDPKYAAKLSRGKATVKQLDPLMVACPKSGTCYPVGVTGEASYSVGDTLMFSKTGELLEHTPKVSKAKSSTSSNGMTMHSVSLDRDKWQHW